MTKFLTAAALAALFATSAFANEASTTEAGKKQEEVTQVQGQEAGAAEVQTEAAKN